MNIFEMELASITISGRLKQKKIVERIFAKPINLTTFLEIRKTKKRSYTMEEGGKAGTLRQSKK